MTKWCHYCGEEIMTGYIAVGLAVKIGRDRYAHTGCIDSHGKENTMNDHAKDTLGAADYAHQSIGLARDLLQESLGNMGQVLTCGCMDLGPASLGSTMRLGQKLKELSFILDVLLKDAHGLCVLLGRELGVCEDDPEPWADLVEGSHEGRGALSTKPAYDDDEPHELRLSYGDRFSPMGILDSEDLVPGEDEFDDDEQPF